MTTETPRRERIRNRIWHEIFDRWESSDKDCSASAASALMEIIDPILREELGDE